MPRAMRMPQINYVSVAGRAVNDLETFCKTDGGIPVSASFRFAMTTRFAKGNEPERVTFLNVKVLGEVSVSHALQVVKRGEALYLQGRLEDDIWKDRDTGADRRAIKLIAERIQPLAWPEDGAPASEQHASSSAAADDDDLPF